MVHALQVSELSTLHPHQRNSFFWEGKPSGAREVLQPLHLTVFGCLFRGTCGYWVSNYDWPYARQVLNS